jgi:6-phosphogluconolactonase
MGSRPHIVVEPDARQVAHAAAERIVDWAGQAIDARGRFTIALAGGSTPKATYQRLASEPHRDAIDWSRVHVFWGDERCVPPMDRSSNYGMAHASLLSGVPIPDHNVHRMRGELDAEAAAQAYADELRRFFGGVWPRFDLVVLGMGTDGHTAALFPGSPVLAGTQRAVVAVMASYQDRPACRLTLTLRAINAARIVVFLVTGEHKADIVRQVFENRQERLPAQHIQPLEGELHWLLDAAAASKLSI